MRINAEKNSRPAATTSTPYRFFIFIFCAFFLPDLFFFCAFLPLYFRLCTYRNRYTASGFYYSAFFASFLLFFFTCSKVWELLKAFVQTVTIERNLLCMTMHTIVYNIRNGNKQTNFYQNKNVFKAEPAGISMYPIINRIEAQLNNLFLFFFYFIQNVIC